MRLSVPQKYSSINPASLMKLRPLILLLAAASITVGAADAFAAPRSWEALKSERADARTVARETEVEIKTAPSTIIITTSKPMVVKVYTILGQLISSETLPAGTSQLRVAGHGVYIVKIGNYTCKVAL